MTIETAIYTRLKNDSGVAALVSTRIYPMFAPQEPIYPLIVYDLIDTNRRYAHDGAQSPTTVRMQIDSMGSTLSSAKSVAAAVLSSLSAYTGTVSSTQIVACFNDNELNLWDPDAGVVRVTQDYLITFMEV